MGRGGGVQWGWTRLASVTFFRILIIYKPIRQHVLVQVEEGELHPRDAHRLPGVAPHKLEPEGHFVRGCVCPTPDGVRSIQVDLRECSVDFIL